MQWPHGNWQTGIVLSTNTYIHQSTDTSTAHGAHLASTCAKALTALDTHSGRQVGVVFILCVLYYVF